MVDGGMTISLNDSLASRLSKKAEALGISPETLALSILDDGLPDKTRSRDQDHPSWPNERSNGDQGLGEPGRAWNESQPEWEQKLATESRDLVRPATRPEDYEGPFVELEDALTAFDAECERRLTKRAE